MSMTNEDAAARLKPYVDDFLQTFADGKIKDMGRFYHKNSVLIETDKSVHFGPEAIVKSFEEADAATGKATFILQNAKYEGVGDFINLDADFELKTENVGNLRGHFLHIWRKVGNEYVIYHDEFQMF